MKTAATVLTRSGLVFLGLFPCLVSAGFHAAGPTPTEMPLPEDRPALAFDQYAVNRGQMPPLAVARALFRFTNAGDHPVTITDLRTSCGCLKPRLDKRIYAPGESGEFVAQVATAGEQPGPRHYTITVDYLDPEPRSVVLTFRMELPERQLYVSPRALLVYQFGSEPVKQDIVLTDTRANSATVIGVDSPADFLSAELAETQTEDDGSRTTRIEVTVQSISGGVRSGIVKIFTDDPRFPVLSVPVRVHHQPPISQLPESAAKR